MTIETDFFITACFGSEGPAGTPGKDGCTPFINTSGNWQIGEVDTGVKAAGKNGAPGDPGLTPFVNAAGNWQIGGTDTGVKAIAKDGKDGAPGKDGASASVAVAGTETLNADEEAEVINRGTALDVKLFFRIPKGERGEGTTLRTPHYNTFADLLRAHPSGTEQESYVVGDQNYVYIWDHVVGNWVSIGRLGWLPEDLQTFKDNVENHLNDKNNPHNVTKAHIGLDKVNNTADADKPISSAVKAALDNKQDKLFPEQMAVLNSGISAYKVNKYDSYAEVLNNTYSKTETDEKITAATATKVSADETGKIPANTLPTATDEEPGIIKPGTGLGVDEDGTLFLDNPGMGFSVGTVYYSQSSLNTDNPGALPLFTGETIDGFSQLYPVFYAYIKNHPELCKTEEEYSASISTFGECPFYVLDEEANSLRLPKLAHYVKMANVTDGISQKKAGMPNITGRVFQCEASYNVASGAFHNGGGTSQKTSNGGGAGVYVDFDASKSSPVYGSSDTVTPAHTTLYPWVIAYHAERPDSTQQVEAILEAGANQVSAVNTAGVTQTASAAAQANLAEQYAQSAAQSAAVSRGLAVGTVYYSQSSLNTDNPGALPLFTGETIASANTIYPDFWAWVSAHEELCVTAEAYASALETYGECPYYVLDAAAGSMRLPKLAHYVKMANATDGITQQKSGLPNITGTFSNASWFQNNPLSTGCFESSLNTGIKDGASGNNGSQTSLDASKSSPVYGSSDTVTPAHTTLYPWVMAFTHAVEASVAQASAFQQVLSQKMDRMSLWSSDTFACLRRKMTDLDWANLQTAGTGTSYTSHTFTVPFDGVLFGISPYSQKITLNGQVLPCYTGGDYGASLYAPLPVNRGDVVKGYMYPAYCFVVPYKLQGGENILSTGLNYYGKYASLEALNAASATVLSNGYGQGLWALVGGETTGYTRYYTKPANDTFTSYEWAEGGTDMYIGPDTDYVVERYRDENGNWYRKYKSGWLEQGGWAASNGINEITVTLLKPFANTKYWAFSTLEQAGTANVCGQCYSGSKKTATAFQTYLQQSSGWWYAGGQGAEE